MDLLVIKMDLSEVYIMVLVVLVTDTVKEHQEEAVAQAYNDGESLQEEYAPTGIERLSIIPWAIRKFTVIFDKCISRSGLFVH